MARIAIEPDYFTMPDDPDVAPRLLGSYSPQADERFWPPRRRCPITGGPVTDIELANEGVLHAWTFVVSRFLRDGTATSGEEGHGLGLVDLDDGVRVQAFLRGDMGDWEIGMRMRLELYPVMTTRSGDELCGVWFRPIATTGAAA